MSAHSSIGQLVLAQLHARLHDAGLGEVTPAVEEAALRVLDREVLTSAEEALLEDEAFEEASDPIALLLGERIEQALLAGLDAAGADAATHRPTEILVLRDACEERLPRVLKKLRTHISERMKGGDNRVLLVAGKHLYSKVKQLIPAGRVGGLPTVEFSEDGTEKHATTAAIEVVSADLSIETLEREASVRVGELRGETAGADSMRDAWLAAAGESLATDGEAATGKPLAERPTVPAPTEGRDPDPMIGELFHSKYRIVRRLGKGGFGSVYEAMDERGAGNRVAIKVLSGRAAESAAQQQSFKDEARRVTRLSHPNIVDWKVFDETDDGVPYFVMELVAGEEFESTLRRERKIAPERVARLLLQVLDALRAAHHLSDTQSILHLDLKPANLFRIPPRTGREEQLKVIDFGIGQFIGDETVQDGEVVPSEDLAPEDLDGPSTLTFARPAGAEDDPAGVTRSKGCTPEYASPEQCEHVMNKPDIVALDGRSDLYSLGVMAFEMLTGQLPFRSSSRLDIMRMHREDPAPSVGAMGVKVPRKLARFVDRCLRKDRDERWRNTQEAFQDLHEIVHPPVWKAIAKVTVPIVLLAAVLGSWMWSTRDVLVREVGLTTSAGRDLETTPLFLGPAHPSAEVTVAAKDGGELGEHARAESWRVLRAADLGESESWSAAWSSDSTVELRAVGDAPGRLDDTVELWLGERRLRSLPVRLVWLGADSWEVTTTRVGERPVSDLEGLSLRPAGTKIKVGVRGPARGEIARVGLVTTDGGEISLTRGDSRSDELVFSRDLGDAGLEEGPNDLVLTVLDEAGRTLERELRLDVTSKSLEARAVLVDSGGGRDAGGESPEVVSLRGSYLVSPRTRPVLRITLSRPADLSWSARRISSTESELRGRGIGKRDYELPLEGLGELGGGQAFEGVLEVVLDESAYVLHPAGSESAVRRETLRFTFEDSRPTFAVSWGVGASGSPLDVSRPHFTNSGEATVVVARREGVPMHVAVDWFPPGDEAQATSVESQELYNPQVQQVRLPVSLGGDGAWTLRVRSFRYDPSTRSLSERAEVEESFTVVLDRTAPRLELVGLSDGHVFGSLESAPDDLVVRLSDETAGGAPVDLEWELVREGDPASTAGGTVRDRSDVGGEVLLGLGGVLRDAELLGDGDYRLRVTGSDRAGNVVEESSIGFVVAARGPSLEIAEPSGVGKWRANAADGLWYVRVAALDENGVGDVSCELVAGDVRIAVPLERVEGSADRRWQLLGTLTIPYTLSGADVNLVLGATDVHGAVSGHQPASYSLPTISRPEPDRVHVAFGEHDVESMRLVRGNAGFQYLFGGRGDEVENPAFVEAGLGEFNDSPRRSRSRSWQVPFAAGAIESYYLDEHEVSVAQYRAFLEAEDGYRAQRCWPDGCAPTEAGRIALLEHCAGLSGDLPVSGVSWAEASAYAAWVGKRLPSWVEWEYAVRGGAEYRPFAGYSRDDPSAVRLLEASARLAPREEGAWTSDGRFADLGTNLSEWTCSGVHAEESSGLYPHQWANADPTRLLPSERVADEYWVAGGHFEQGRVDFSVADLRTLDTRSATIGFRCAATLSDVQDRLGLRVLGGPCFEERP